MTIGTVHTPAADHRIRLILRVHTGDLRRELELAVPSTACLGEIFPEVLGLTEISATDHSWQFSTALGLPLSPTTPLELMPIKHGDVVVMEPRQSYPAPVVRDCADAIGDVAGDVELTAPVSIASWILGVAALTALGVHCQIPLWSIAAVIAALGAVLLVWSSLNITLSVTTVVGTALATYLLVLQGSVRASVEGNLQGSSGSNLRGGQTPSSSSDLSAPETSVTGVASALPQEATQWQDHGLALLCAAGAAVLVVSVLAAMRRLPLKLSTALITAGAFGIMGAGVLAWSGKPLTAGSVLLLVSLVGSLKAPALAIALAGVPLPVLPAAGEDLSVSDRSDGADGSDSNSQESIHDTAARATALHAGLMSAVGAMATISCFIIAVHGGLYAQSTCLAAAGAFILHALRHRQSVPVWSLLAPGLSSVAGIALGSQPPGGVQDTISLVLGILGALTLVTVPLWVARLREITPTTQMWLERAETLCIAALIPLSAQVAGLFYLIRSLG